MRSVRFVWMLCNYCYAKYSMFIQTMWKIMYNYHQIKNWHGARDGDVERCSENNPDAEDTFSRHYVKTKLENGLLRVWRVSGIIYTVESRDYIPSFLHASITDNYNVYGQMLICGIVTFLIDSHSWLTNAILLYRVYRLYDSSISCIRPPLWRDIRAQKSIKTEATASTIAIWCLTLSFFSSFSHQTGRESAEIACPHMVWQNVRSTVKSYISYCVYVVIKVPLLIFGIYFVLNMAPTSCSVLNYMYFWRRLLNKDA